MSQWLVLCQYSHHPKYLALVWVLDFPYFPDIMPFLFTSPEMYLLPCWTVDMPPTIRQLPCADGTRHTCNFPSNLSQTHLSVSLTPSIIHWNLYLFMTSEIRTGRCDCLDTWYKIASSSAEAINPCFLWNVTSCYPAQQTVSIPVSFGTEGKLRTINLYRMLWVKIHFPS